MSAPVSDRQLFELELEMQLEMQLEQLKTNELLEKEEMWAQRVIDESAGGSNRNAELNAARDSSESGS